MIDTREFSAGLTRFNEKYGVNFDYQEFEKQRIKYDRLDIDKPGNVAYNLVFAKYYKQALRGVLTGNIKELNSPEMLKDFEELIMAPYRAKCIAENEPNGSEPYGGKTHLQALESMRIYANEAPKTVADFYGEKYKDGLLHLRDFRSFAEHYTGAMDQQEMAANFIVGLERVHNNRSFWWKVAHPIQNYCEQRDLKYLKSELNYDKIKYLVDNGSGLIEAETTYLDKLIRVEKSGTGEIVERVPAETIRESISIDGLDDSLDINEYEDQIVDDDDLNLSQDSVSLK
jgi:hypothetical protein